jgi:protein-tyrosine phosphatase
MVRNLRDLGGIRTASGQTIKKGFLVRSANLSEAEEEDLSGISAVIDLRTTRESEEVPDRLYGRTSVHVPIFDEVKTGVSHERRAERERKGPPDMGALYIWMMREHRDSFANALRAIMNHDFSSGAVLWHCSEGKDRCGLTTALLLELLGVDRSVIMEDYLKTNETSIPRAEGIRERVRAERGDEVAEGVYRAYIAVPEYLEGAWKVMDEIPNCLSELGIPQEEITRFREFILE